jgi:hypothetical protein
MCVYPYEGVTLAYVPVIGPASTSRVFAFRVARTPFRPGDTKSAAHLALPVSADTICPHENLYIETVFLMICCVVQARLRRGKALSPVLSTVSPAVLDLPMTQPPVPRG